MNPDKFNLLSDLAEQEELFKSQFGMPELEVDPSLTPPPTDVSQIPQLEAPSMDVSQDDISAMSNLGSPDMDRQAGLDKIRSDLMKRLEGYDPSALEAERNAALEAAKPGTDVKVARALSEFFGGMGGKQSNLAMFGKQDKDARAEALQPFDQKSKQFQQDLGAYKDFQALDKSDRQEEWEKTKWGQSYKLQQDKFEMDAKKIASDMPIKELDLKIKQSLYSDTTAARDPASQQSQNARQMIKEFMGKDTSEKMSAAELAPLVKELPNLIKQKAAAEAKAQVDLVKPSEGEKTFDREFAKTYEGWQSQGKPQYLENAKLFQDAIQKVKSGDVDTGTIEGLKSRQDVFDTKTKALEREVRSAINGMLRQTLGAQFTEKEGERIFAQAFDPKAKPEDNVRSMERELGKIQKTADSIEERGRYFEANKGSLKGYKAPEVTPQSSRASASDFPKQVRKGNQIATVSNAQELEEAMSEGFK